MQSPTCTRLRIRTVRDAEIILHAVFLGRLPIIHHRLDDDDRMALTSGCIYVWEERSNNPLEATGQDIQRFTEGRSWGPSRARDDFLLYYEKESQSRSSLLLRNNLAGSSQLIKQTYSVFVHVSDSPVRKWHLNAYYTQDTVDQLNTVDDVPALRSIQVPPGRYVCARTSGARRSARPTLRTASATSNRSSYALSSSSSDLSRDSPTPSLSSPLSDSPSTSTIPLRRLAAPLAAASTDAHAPSDRQLAPLEYLQNISPKARDPIDDQALQSFKKRI